MYKRQAKVQTESPTALTQLLDNTHKHLRALNALGQPTQYWDSLIVYMVSERLVSFTQREWESKVSISDLPTLDDMVNFLTHKCQVLENIEPNKHTMSRQNKHQQTKYISPQKHASYTTTNECFVSKCNLCDKAHPLFFLRYFQKHVYI